MMDKQKVALLICTSFLGLLGLYGCGSGGEEEDSNSTISKTAFIKKADAICRRASKTQVARYNEYVSQHPNGAAPEDIVRFAGVPPLTAEVRELSSLPLPSTGQKEATAYIAAVNRGVRRVAQDPAVMTSDGELFADAEAIAAEFGFTICGGS
jgi:hypothetical protein